MTWWKYILTALVGIVVGLLIMFLMQRCKPDVPVEPVVIHDTISIHDTAYIASKTKVIEVIRWDTIREYEYDTLTQYAVVPIEQKEYRDTFATDSSRTELAVRFSGYHAQIDSVGLIQEWTIQPRVVEKKKGWGWVVAPSIQVGYGVAIGRSAVIAAPYVGVGVSVGFGYSWIK